MEYTEGEIAAMGAATAGANPLAVLLVLVVMFSVFPLVLQLATRLMVGFKPTYGTAFKTFAITIGVTLVAAAGIGMLMGLISRLMGVVIDPNAPMPLQIVLLSFGIAVASAIWTYKKFLRNPSTGQPVTTMEAARIYAAFLFIIFAFSFVLQLLTGGMAPTPPSE